MISMRDLLNWLREREPEIVHLLGRMVGIESPSHEKVAVDRFGSMIASEWRRRGAGIRLLHQRNFGNHVRAEIWLGRGRPKGQLLVLGHLDTVYPTGTLAKTAFRVARGCAWGPGAFDMKGGHAIALFAVDALRALRVPMRKKIIFLWTSDEEIGSAASRSAIEKAARQSDAVFVLEPAFGGDGRLKTERKGVGEAELIVTGRSAHAGIDPQRGVNAVHELALQIVRLLKLNNPKRGITVQANVIAGGSVTNVVAERARASIDVRLMRASDARAVNRKLHALRPILPGARIEVRGGINRPPMERTPEAHALFLHAQELGRKMGISLAEASTGGGSDGNFTAALGIPTLDGLGAVGDGAHSPREHIVIRHLPERAALLAGLLATL
ncbi:MAG TPA: M20 family metallopeptidase [Candidatus Acidoferrales bacterium]|nr:M20 family metallopeptidase [Candidatus Acidoferrales bacterium]